MRIIRYFEYEKQVLAAVTDSDDIYRLPYSSFLALIEEADLNNQSPLQLVGMSLNENDRITQSLHELNILAPIEAPEVWAAGVTYERSKEARNYESAKGKLDAMTFYDKVYDAERPEIFLKSTASRTVSPNQELYLRSDSTWQIPEPELGLVIKGNGTILGYTIGNDMSCRDIEGENPLYLPQAKIWKHSCSIGPAIRLVNESEDPYQFEIKCSIYRNNERVVEGKANTSQLKRKYDELISYLIKDNEIFDGTILLTGTCIVPPNDFTLQDGDRVEIEITGIGQLNNSIRQYQKVTV